MPFQQKDWVFEGADKSSEVQPLFGKPKDPLKAAQENWDNAPGTLVDLIKGEKRGDFASAVMASLAASMPAPEAAGQVESKPGQGAPSVEGGVSMADMQALVGQAPQGALTAQAVVAPAAGAQVSGADFLSLRQAANPQQKGGEGMEQAIASPAKAEGPRELGVGQVERRKRPSEVGATLDKAEAVTGMRNLVPGATVVAKAQPMTAQVVQGSMARERFATDTLNGVSSRIVSLSGNGGGEMRLRLKPDHLGELQLRVAASGNEVGLQVHASSEKARRVLEESLGSLKEALSSQGLSLSRVDVAVSPVLAGADSNANRGMGSESFQQNQSSDQGAAAWNSYQDSRQGSRGGDSWSDGSMTRRGPGLTALGENRPAASAYGNSQAGAGRIDVRA